ncbi:hypothetical protein [Neorhizobium sp. P12A]|nr:hypothetical protein [Neorhizobium sp. P12A]
MRVMIAVVVLMIASILSLVVLNPSGEGQAANGGQLEASITPPQAK